MKKYKHIKYGARPKKEVSDLQFKHQVIFTIEGMKANLGKIGKMFPEGTFGRYVDDRIVSMYKEIHHLIIDIKCYDGKIERRPK